MCLIIVYVNVTKRYVGGRNFVHVIYSGMGLTREKITGNHIFEKKYFIIDKKQTEKWSWRRLKKQNSG